MIVVNLILLVNRLILKKSGDSDETDDSGDTVESSASDKCDKSCYPIEYGYQSDSHNSNETYNAEDSDVFCGSAEPGESGNYGKFVDFGEVTDDIVDFGESADSEESTDSVESDDFDDSVSFGDPGDYGKSADSGNSSESS